MKFPFLKCPKSGQPDIWVTLSVIAVLASIFRFLGEGLTIVFNNPTVSYVWHTDPATYAALLTPILAAHSYSKSRPEDKKESNDNKI